MVSVKDCFVKDLVRLVKHFAQFETQKKDLLWLSWLHIFFLGSKSDKINFWASRITKLATFPGYLSLSPVVISDYCIFTFLSRLRIIKISFVAYPVLLPTFEFQCTPVGSFTCPGTRDMPHYSLKMLGITLRKVRKLRSERQYRDQALALHETDLVLVPGTILDLLHNTRNDT